MGDYIPAQIEIGGPIPNSLLDELVKAILRDGPAIGLDDWDATGSSEEEYRAAIRNAAEDGTTLELCDNQALGGGFDTIEKFCYENDISFCRHSDAKFEIEATWVWWVPGLDKPADCPANNAGRTMVDVDDVRACMKEGSRPSQQILLLKRLLDEKSPPNLPPITITEG